MIRRVSLWPVVFVIEHNMCITAEACLQIQTLLHVAVGVGVGWALGLAASGIAEALTINCYFHILFRVSLHLKVLDLNTHDCFLEPNPICLITTVSPKSRVSQQI